MFKPIMLQVGSPAEIVNNFTRDAAQIVKNVTPGIAILALVCLGVWYVIADQQDVPQIKKWGIRILLGIVIVGGAATIIEYFVSQGTWN